MDWASVAGIALALGGLLVGQLLEGGHLSSLLQPAAFIIVGVGTVGAVLLQSGMPDFVRGVRMAKAVFVSQPDTAAAIEQQVIAWSSQARREGLLSLDRYVNGIKDPFKAKGLRLLVDGIDPFKLKDILETDVDSYERAERRAIKVWDAAGGYAPTVGIIGAVLGLIHVMENLADPTQLGSGIAVAFVATIYGVGLANLVFLPIANKLKSLLAQEVAQREMLIGAFFGIALGDNPRIIQERMSAHRR